MLVAASTVDKVAADELGAPLAADGFEQVGRRTWVRSTMAPIREGVTLRAMKGAQYLPVLFLSLDFVPWIDRSGHLSWRRTAKRCKEDLVVDATDHPDLLPARRVSTFQTEADFQREFRAVATTFRDCQIRGVTGLA